MVSLPRTMLLIPNASFLCQPHCIILQSFLETSCYSLEAVNKKTKSHSQSYALWEDWEPRGTLLLPSKILARSYIWILPFTDKGLGFFSSQAGVLGGIVCFSLLRPLLFTKNVDSSLNKLVFLSTRSTDFCKL